ncbi:Amino acid transporter [Yersinia mollaretii ATCC 43969]|uniref:Amino acid transporter n=1 Tax=Yersinia mollaretii (strain ATCC 43969 / DSM 18520 / CIP 103324 / CNY 7263 / WAIP 204) TaxID=349967 RepID=A0ABM9YBE7_YERMW|nr:Amino acid transporter [Yersinia mollaretii ATCC 43969]PJE87622.1 hypothetical protein CU280_11325 [Yersinia mollaretii]QKJ01525.1 hypothetical protein HRD69_20400 [Yersinia mollaretii ATCC 43969]
MPTSARWVFVWGYHSGCWLVHDWLVLAFAQMFGPTVGKIIMALIAMSCCGSLPGWQFTIITQ